MMRHMRMMVVAACLAAMAGCSSGGTSTGSTSPSPVTSAAGSGLAGTWVGRDTKSTVVWTLTQEGSNVTGTSTFSEPGASGRGTVTGTLTGPVFSFKDVYPTLTGGCSATIEGDLTIAGATMAGAYHGTNSCTGPFQESISFTRS